MKTILLTGGTGFLGSHLFKNFLRSYQVILLKRSFSETWRITKALLHKNCIIVDIDKEKIIDVFENNKIDAIVHCATEYGRSNTSAIKVLETNLLLPIELIEHAIKFKTNCFINTDSYFNKGQYFYRPLPNYSLSKKSLLTWMHAYSSKIKMVNLVLEHIYGEHDQESKFVEMCIKKIGIEKIENLNLTPGLQIRDFIYVTDVVKAYTLILDHTLKNNFDFKTYQIGTGKGVSIQNFLHLIKEISGSNTKLNFGALDYREGEIKKSQADLSELYKIGWKDHFITPSAIAIKNILKSKEKM